MEDLGNGQQSHGAIEFDVPMIPWVPPRDGMGCHNPAIHSFRVAAGDAPSDGGVLACDSYHDAVGGAGCSQSCSTL